MSPLRPIALLLLASALSGCGYAWTTPANPQGGGGYMAERRPMPSREDAGNAGAERWNAAQCASAAPAVADFAAAPPARPVLSPGDLVRVSVPGEEAPHGLYKVDTAGVIALARLGDLPVGQRTAAEVEEMLGRLLVARGYFRPGFARVSVQVLDRGPVRVSVGGAVFQPGQVVVNRKAADERDAVRDMASGDHAIGRSVSHALASAAGVRPDADIAHVAIVSGGRRRVVDLTGLVEGGGGEDPALADGDRVEVPSRGCFQMALARPSPITPPGVRVFFSNLTSPAANNAGAAVGREATSLPYGTRLLQALASGNCIGGIQLTNADRWAVLVSTNPLTGGTEVIERRIEALVRRADRDAYNPVILPGDAIACYDSAVTNYRDVVRTLLEPVTGLLRPL